MRISAEQVVKELAEAGFRLLRRDDELLPYQYVVELVPVSPTADRPAQPGEPCLALGEGDCRKAGVRCCNPLLSVCGSKGKCVPLE